MDRIRDGWLIVIRRYFAAFVVLSLLWEVSQAPLYSVWVEGTPGWIAFSILHCTGGDILIGIAILLTALVFGGTGWPENRSVYMRVAAATIAIGVSYAVYSEWLNVVIRHTWQYRDLMPTLPIVGTGLSPLLQWIVVPIISFWWAATSSWRST